MKLKQFKYISFLLILFIGLLPTLLTGQTGGNAKGLLEKAKLELFDRKWSEALTSLEKLIVEYPDSPLYATALFYKAKCLEELKRSKNALRSYTRYLEVSKNKNLREEATIAIIDLNYRLYANGETRYLNPIIPFFGALSEPSAIMRPLNSAMPKIKPLPPKRSRCCKKSSPMKGTRNWLTAPNWH